MSKSSKHIHQPTLHKASVGGSTGENNAPSISGKSPGFNPGEGRFESGRGGRFVPVFNWKEWEAFIRNNNDNMNNQQMAEIIGCKPSTVAMIRIKLGLKKMEFDFWTEPQTETLNLLYHIMGDTEMAELFNELFPKKKTWTKKHIEKKRKYLNLKRTKEELKTIWRRNLEQGRFGDFIYGMGAVPEDAGLIRLATWLAPKNKEVQQELLKQPDLLELYRQNLILKNTINESIAPTRKNEG